VCVCVGVCVCVCDGSGMSVGRTSKVSATPMPVASCAAVWIGSYRVFYQYINLWS